MSTAPAIAHEPRRTELQLAWVLVVVAPAMWSVAA